MIGASKTARAILDVHIIGDDLICTNSVLLQKAIAEKACTCMVRKPNQVGTIRGDSRTAKGQCMALLLPSGQAALRSDERGSFLAELTCILAQGSAHCRTISEWGDGTARSLYRSVDGKFTGSRMVGGSPAQTKKYGLAENFSVAGK